jgi:hypothetical protein
LEAPQNRPLVAQPLMLSRPTVMEASSVPITEPEVLTSNVDADPAG